MVTWFTVPRLAAAGSAVTALLAVAACGSSTPSTGSSSSSGSGSANVSLAATEYSFAPNQLSVPAGASVNVTFKNNGTILHSFTLNNGNASVDADPGSSKTVTFTAPQSGTLLFHCRYHPTQMMGTITVGGSGGAGAGSSSTGSSSSSSTGY